MGAALAAELESALGDTLLLRLPPATEIPGSSLFGRRDTPGLSLRVSVRGTLPADALGEFSLSPRQRPVGALFVPLKLLQKSLGVEGRANTALLGESSAPPPLTTEASLEDLGLRLREDAAGVLVLESTSALLADDVVGKALETAKEEGLRASTVLIYLANEIRSGERTIPYSLVAALDDDTLASLGGKAPTGRPVFLNAWAAQDLGARPGSDVTLSYYLWEEEGRLDTREAAFTYAGVVPMKGLGADPRLVPDYPGITESAHISDWDPPFPVDLGKIRPRDEAYWEAYRAAPKAFVPLAVGQELWGHRLGRVTSIRIRPRPGADLREEGQRFEKALRGRIDPARAGLVAEGVREEALRAAQGSTDFGEYFVYFSFFLVVAALVLAGLFFRLGVEQRLREIGLLRSVGFARKDVRRLFLAEGVALSVLGGLLGIAWAFAYADLVVRGLRTLWVGAVGTRELMLHVSPLPLVIGFAGGVTMAALAVALTLRGLRRRSPRSLLSGATEEWTAPSRRGTAWLFLVPASAALLLLLASALGRMPPAGAFFGAGGLLLVAALLATAALLRGRSRRPVRRLVGLGFRGASFRPGRSVLCVALIAAASFVIVSVGSFRRETVDTSARDGESGGYTLVATSLLPLHTDPASVQGQESLSLPADALQGISLARFRMRKGDDASCLNLYRPADPTVLAPSEQFLDAGRFAFQASLATTPEEKANPWRLLDGERRSGAIPVIADASSLAYVLHRKLGEEMEVGGARVVFVGALRPGLFQGELLMGERHFRSAFPEEEGYRFFLFDAPPERQAALTEALESGLSDFGLDVGPTAARLADYHRVENTYISTFQALGALGLVLGTVGLGAVLLRNALERRRELALLQAVGFRRRHISQMVLAENLLLLVLGLGIGTLTALLAVVPVLRERPGVVPFLALIALLLTVLLVGLGASRLGVIVLRRLPLLASLRSE